MIRLNLPIFNRHIKNLKKDLLILLKFITISLLTSNINKHFFSPLETS
jgi:hypothetical protein